MATTTKIFLKINSDTRCNTLFENLISLGFIPKITLPTHISRNDKSQPYFRRFSETNFRPSNAVLPLTRGPILQEKQYKTIKVEIINEGTSLKL